MIFNVCHIIVSHVPCVPNQPGFDNPNRPDKCSFASGYRNALLSHLKSYRPHDHIRRQLRRHMKNVRLLKNNHIAPTLLQLNTGRDGRNQRYPQGELFQITPSKCVYCTVSWNVARLVWCRSLWWETAGCSLHGGPLWSGSRAWTCPTQPPGCSPHSLHRTCRTMNTRDEIRKRHNEAGGDVII